MRPGTSTETLQQFVVREMGGRGDDRVVIEVLYPRAGVKVSRVRPESEIGRMIFEIFRLWPSVS